MIRSATSTYDQDRATEILEQIYLGRIERSIIEYLVDRFGRSTPTVSLVNAAYGDDPNGGPDNAGNVIKAHVLHLNRKLRPYGLRIVHDGTGSRKLIFDMDLKGPASL
jgi:hypothetical protein